MDEAGSSIEDAIMELEQAMVAMSGSEAEYVLVLDAYDLLREALQMRSGK